MSSTRSKTESPTWKTNTKVKSFKTTTNTNNLATIPNYIHGNPKLAEPSLNTLTIKKNSFWSSTSRRGSEKPKRNKRRKREKRKRRRRSPRRKPRSQMCNLRQWWLPATFNLDSRIQKERRIKNLLFLNCCSLSATPHFSRQPLKTFPKNKKTCKLFYIQFLPQNLTIISFVKKWSTRRRRRMKLRRRVSRRLRSQSQHRRSVSKGCWWRIRSKK